MVAATSTKDYGILSVVFQIYADTMCHFKIPPTVFYPKPKVDSALVGLHFLGPSQLRQRLAGVDPSHLRRVVTTTFQQRRKTVRNSLKKLCREITGGDSEKAQALLNSPPLPLPAVVQEAADAGDKFALLQQLPIDWASKRPEQLSPGQFIELTRLLFGPADGTSSAESSMPLGRKVWRKLKHGQE
jgi:16S rRNA A1518/A1519 N6-dimethyltransferase RsmA/KsgA/DIM1 with predicted DNA glycosylase/AP lyase activity